MAGISPPPALLARTRWAWLVATFLGIGHIPRRFGPGTWASAATVLLWWLASHLVPWPAQSLALALALFVVIAAGLPAASVVEREAGRHDPSLVVIDEVAGQLLALIAVPVQWKSLLASFILFRAFDVLKPPPCRRLEKFPGGTGVMLDDVGAGLYALAVMHALLYFRIMG